jgi:hypothetical protein
MYLLEANSDKSPHAVPVPQVCKALQTEPQGLTQVEAEARLQPFGLNVIRWVKGKPLYPNFLANFTHLMAILLWAGGGAAHPGRGTDARRPDAAGRPPFIVPGASNRLITS